MFSAVTVDGNRLYYNAYQVVDGEAVCVDSFAIESTDTAAPSDKVGALDDMLTNFLAMLNIKLVWKPLNFILGLFGKMLALFGMM